MAKFDVNKKGYDTEQVDSFINKLSLKYEEKLAEQKDRVFSLKNELNVIEERLNNYRDKDKQISQALIYAVEKAEQIENNASKLYDLEIKRMRLLYKQWEELVSKLNLPDLSIDTKSEVDKFKVTVDEVLEQNKRLSSDVIRNDLRNNSDNYIRNLLNRMDYTINSKSKNSNTSKGTLNALSAESEKENARLIDLSGKLDSITVKGSGNMAENFLNSDVEITNAYAKNFARKEFKNSQKNTNGFDMEDILNPKEDLDEIMKAFDFFLENNQD